MSSIRTVVQGIIKKGEQILVIEFFDEKQGYYYRSVGGGIEFGERSELALKREFKEELNADIKNLRLLGVIENIYGTEGAQGHEIDFIYDAEFTESEFYQKNELQGVEGSNSFKVVWKPISFFKLESSPPLFPEGVINLIRTTQLST